MSAQDKIGTVAHEEGELDDKPQGYTGDHVTDRREKSATEKSLVWKAASLFTALAAFTYFVAYLDRNAIGNARVAGMQTDLGLSNNQYSSCVSMFFVGYIIFMWPANIILKVVHPNYIIGGSALLFGAFTCGLAGASSYATVLSLRVLVGCSQAFIQGLTMYSSFWFRRNEMAIVAGSLYSAATISGAFSGFIAYGCIKNLTEAETGREPWRWLYIIDGSVAMFVGGLVCVLLPRFPEDILRKGKHWLFTKEEIEVACERSASFNTLGEKVNFRQVTKALKDLKSWLFVLMNIGIGTGIGTVGVFLPSFIHGLGFSPLNTQLFSAVPYACAFVTLILLSVASDRVNQKGIFLIGTLSTSIIGYIILLTNASIPVKIFATCLIVSGLYPSVILLVTWLSINTAGFTKRGTTWAMAEVGGQCMSIMGTHVYTDPPRYIQGHSVILALVCTALLSVITLRFWMKYCNAKKDRIEEEYRERGERHPHKDRTLEEECDQHQSFRYIL